MTVVTDNLEAMVGLGNMPGTLFGDSWLQQSRKGSSINRKDEYFGKVRDHNVQYNHRFQTSIQSYNGYPARYHEKNWFEKHPELEMKRFCRWTTFQSSNGWGTETWRRITEYSSGGRHPHRKAKSENIYSSTGGTTVESALKIILSGCNETVAHAAGNPTIENEFWLPACNHLENMYSAGRNWKADLFPF